MSPVIPVPLARPNSSNMTASPEFPTSPPLRILYCGLNFAPETMGCARYANRTAASLRAAGHEVRAIAAPPHFPEHIVWESYNPRAWSGNFHQGETVHCPMGLRSTRGFIRRAVAGAVFGACCQLPLRRAEAWRPDIIWTVAPTMACAPAVLECARRTGALAWLHVQDFESGALRSLSRCPSFVWKWAEKLEHRLLRRFDLVSTIAPHMVGQLEQAGVAPEQTHLFPNPADLNCLVPLDELAAQGNAFRRKAGIQPTTPVVLLAGTIGRKQGAGRILELGARLSRKNVLLLVSGCGAGFDELRRHAEHARGLQLLPAVSDQELPGLLAAANLHLVMLRPGADRFCHPSRLANILATGGSVVVSSRTDGPLHDWVRQHHHSALHAPCDHGGEMAETILRGLEQLPRRNAFSRQSALCAVNPRAVFPALHRWLGDARKAGKKSVNNLP